MPQPKGFIDKTHPNYICKLHKSLPGIKQAPHACYDRLHLTLCSWPFVNSRVDTSLFTFSQGKSCVWVLVYVDKILKTRNNQELLNLVFTMAKQHVCVKRHGSINYSLGMEVTHHHRGMHLSQAKYKCDLLKRTKMTNCKSSPSPTSSIICISKDCSALMYDAYIYRSMVVAYSTFHLHILKFLHL